MGVIPFLFPLMKRFSSLTKKIALKNPIQLILLLCLILSAFTAKGQQSQSDSSYEYRNGDPNGIGKWYLGREIAYVMGYQGISWLERPEREKEEKTSVV